MKNTSASTKLEDYTYQLPEELIAQKPALERDSSRLLVLVRSALSLQHKKFSDLTEYLEPGDLLVFNDTRVIPARLLGQKESGGKVEVLLLRELSKGHWEALVRPGKRLRKGTRLIFGEELSGEILQETTFGGREIRFEYSGDFQEILQREGFIPLPPYITAHQAVKAADPLAERYQTVYARSAGSAAAPTAGLHFTPELLSRLEAKGVRKTFVTLHTGLGTFRPIATTDIRDHQIHQEWFELTQEAVAAISSTKAAGKRVIAVGTTSVRVLESFSPEQLTGFTSIYIYPGYRFRNVDGLITNFHLPGSTLLVLVSAFAGRETVLAAYQEAIKERYRFFSFGDAMLLL